MVSEGPLRPVHGETTRPRPHGELPVWIGGGSSTQSVDLAAELGCPLMLPSVFAPFDSFAPLVERYRAGWAEAGHAGAPRVGACCHTHVAADSQTARRQFRPFYENYWHWVQDLIRAYTPHARAVPFDYETLVAGPAIVGSPQEVGERIDAARQLLGLDRMIFMFDLGGMPEDLLMPTIELFGRQVLQA